MEIAPSDDFTQLGERLTKLPDFGSLAMSKTVLAALLNYNCGHNLICLSSILSVLNTTALLKHIPQSMKSSDGDFMTLLNVMNTILSIKESVRAHHFEFSTVCENKGLSTIAHIIQQAMRRYERLKQSFSLSKDYCERAQVQSGNWEFIAKSLLVGYYDNVFISMKELHERTHRFARYNQIDDIAILDLQSTLTRPISQAPVSIVLARDIRYATAIRSAAVLSFVGEIKPSWIGRDTQRDIEITHEEEKHLSNKNTWSRIKSKFSKLFHSTKYRFIVSLTGKTGIIINDELHFRKQLVTTMTFRLENNCPQNSVEYDNLSKNLQSISKMMYIFNPMKWRWEAQKQVKIMINNDPANKTCKISAEGRDSENQNVKKEFDSFLLWLKRCAVIRNPKAGE